jgi:hypothetical protein
VNPWQSEAARLLRVAMGGRGACRKAFAAEIGITPAHLCMLESGQRRPSLDLAAKIERSPIAGVPMIAWTQPPRSQVVNSSASQVDPEIVRVG